MDFGEILEIWDKQQKKESQPLQPRQKEQRTAEKVNPINAWLRVNGVYDKDQEEGNALSPGERRRRLLAKQPDAELDLHGLTADEAWNALDAFFIQSKNRGFAKIRIIHGKGNHSDGDGVLRAQVKRFVENCPYAGESGYGTAKTGGTGSTWVILKNPPAQKRAHSERYNED